jgi:S1-C subfamily serine protease
MKSSVRQRVRFVVVGLILVLGAYWAGAHWGPREPEAVQALHGSLAAYNASGNDASLDALESENVHIYREASPAVGNIVTRTVEYDFFYNAVPVEGAGSGFLIDASGHILTNLHVVQDAQQIEVTLGDQSRYKAHFIGADTRNDIALIQIDPHGKKLASLPLGDSRSLQVGQRVLAIGNPFGFESTLTTGVVSALGRTVQTSDTTFIDEAIQTDAAINRGNSGGPLLNSHGQVIGINSAIYTPSGTTAGIGFAIPINTARRVADDLISKGRVLQAQLGIQGRAIWPDLASALELPVDHGLLIEAVTPNGPAAQAGVRGGNKVVLAGLQKLRIGGDVLTAMDGQPIANQLDLNVMLNRHRPGDTVNLTLYRGKEKIQAKATLGER